MHYEAIAYDYRCGDRGASIVHALHICDARSMSSSDLRPFGLPMYIEDEFVSRRMAQGSNWTCRDPGRESMSWCNLREFDIPLSEVAVRVVACYN